MSYLRLKEKKSRFNCIDTLLNLMCQHIFVILLFGSINVTRGEISSMTKTSSAVYTEVSTIQVNDIVAYKLRHPISYVLSTFAANKPVYVYHISGTRTI